MTFVQISARALLNCRSWKRLSLDSWAGLAILTILSIAPLLVVDLPPLVDLYGHLGRFTIQTELANRPELQKYFSYEWQLVGNLGSDLLVQALHPLFGVEGSVRLIIIATQVLATGGVLALSRTTHGSITPFAIAALPLIYGFPFNYGFLNYSLSMSLAMLAFAFWSHLRCARPPLFAHFWLAIAGSVIWLCHTYGWGFLGLLSGSAVLAKDIDGKWRPIQTARRILGACWPLLLPIVPMTLLRAGAGQAYTGDWSIYYKINWLISIFRTKWIVLDGASVWFIIMLLYWAIRGASLSLDKRLGIAALLSAICFLVLPMYVLGSAFADMRLAPYAVALALLAISPRNLTKKASHVLLLVSFIFFAGRSVTTSLAYIQQGKLVSEHLSALEALPPGARVAFFAITPSESWPLPVLNQLGGYALLHKSVFVNNQWQETGLNPLKIHYKAAEPFDQDPSQSVHPDDCLKNCEPRLSWALQTFPRQAFSHVWIVGDFPDTQSVPADLQPLSHTGKGQLYAVTHTHRSEQ